MKSTLRNSLCLVTLLCGLDHESRAIGPVDPDDPEIQCVSDGICHINGCQSTPDPDCPPLPESPSSSTDTSEPGTLPNTPATTNATDFNYSDTDLIKLTDAKIDFGDNIFLFDVPIGFGSVQWSVFNGFYTPRLIGTLHLKNASGKYARMHMGYNGTSDHTDIVYAPDDKHHSWPINHIPDPLSQITRVTICTEISDNGTVFTKVDCKTVDFN